MRIIFIYLWKAPKSTTHHGLYQFPYPILFQTDGCQVSQHIVPDERYNVAALGPYIACHAGHM